MRKTFHNKVKDFHIKHGFHVNKVLQSGGFWVWLSFKMLKLICWLIKGKALKQSLNYDERLYRVYLMTEELAESTEALYTGDEVGLADGLGDLIYVAVGTNVTYGIPTTAVFNEIHRSNMTKKKRTMDNFRMRDKGPDYVPPDIKNAITQTTEIYF